MVLFVSYAMANFMFSPSTFLSLVLDLWVANDTPYTELHLYTIGVCVSVQAVHLHTPTLDVIQAFL
jgi:hypothetical protein